MKPVVPTIAILGRPNVGKSSLFNRLVGRRKSIVHNQPGVTRDRIEEHVTWWLRGKPYTVKLIDTGGVGGERFDAEIRDQVELALQEASLAVLVFDGQSGYTPLDQEVLREIRKADLPKNIPLIGAVNKVDELSHEDFASDFYESGLDGFITTSAEHGRGIDDLQEQIIETLGIEPDEEKESEEEERPKGPSRIAIVGKPNVGKSTLLNALVGKQRMIASPVAGTTVDSVDSLVELEGKEYVFIDTAGIRRKNKTEQGVEVLSVVKAKKALDRADLAILLMDGEEGIADQDEKIAGLILDSGCSVIIAVNKWDTQKGNADFSEKDAAEHVRKKMRFLNFAPILFISAQKKKGLGKFADLIDEILFQRTVKVKTNEFTEWVRNEQGIHNPRNAKFYLCHQTGRYPPTFACHVNDPKKVHFSLERHLVNGIREKWGFMGSPVRLKLVQSHKSWKETVKRL